MSITLNETEFQFQFNIFCIKSNQIIIEIDRNANTETFSSLLIADTHPCSIVDITMSNHSSECLSLLLILLSLIS